MRTRLIPAACAAALISAFSLAPSPSQAREVVAFGGDAAPGTIVVRTNDELEGLADQFNRMSSQLRESYSGLERKVEERTR